MPTANKPKINPPRGAIPIQELCKIVNRKADTIRAWESGRYGIKLPQHLCHKYRGPGFKRYYTRKQVQGIIDWMREQDLRPGHLITYPENTDKHLENMRRPKLLNGNHFKSAKVFVEQGMTAKQIAEIIFPRTKYKSAKNLETVLRRYFRKNNMYFPPHREEEWQQSPSE